MASERNSRRWIGYDWFKLIVGIILVVLMFWIGRGQGQVVTSAALPTAMLPAPTTIPAVAASTAEPTASVTPTVEPTLTVAPTTSVAPTAAPTVTVAPTVTIAPTPIPTATVSITPTLPVAAGALTISVPKEGEQLPVGPITISGTGPPGSQIEIRDGDQVVGTTTVKDDGTWSVTYTPSVPGTAALTVRPKGGESANTPIRITIGAGVQANCAQLALGCDAWVTRAGGLALRMRSGPGTDQAIIVRLPVGTQITLVEGPSSANGLTWWRVQTKGGSEGWVNGENLVTQPD